MYDHVLRRDDDFVGKRAMELSRRKRGQPNNKSIDAVKDVMNELGLRVENARNLKS